MDISMHRIWSQFRAVLEQPIDNINCLKYAARKKMGEERNIHITDMVIGNPPKASIANMSLGNQIFFGQIVLGSIGSCSLCVAPATWQGAASEAIDNVAIGRIQLLRADVPAIDLGEDLGSDISTQMPGHLVRP